MKRLIIALSPFALSVAISAQSENGSNVSFDLNIATPIPETSVNVSVDANGSVDPSTGVDGDALVSVGVVTPNTETNVNVNANGSVDPSTGVDGDASVVVGVVTPNTETNVNVRRKRFC